MRIVFVHGWGEAPDFWADLASHVQKAHIKAHISYIDLGFVKAKAPQDDEGFGQDSCTIYVGHSLGAPWILKQNFPDMSGLVAINGFSKFTDFVPSRQIETMKKRLERAPWAQMQDFWSRNAMRPRLTDECLNIDALQQGLDQLLRWDMRAALSGLSVPVLSLAGTKDPMLGVAIMADQWAAQELHFCEEGAHVLPQSHPQWCAQKIEHFITTQIENPENL